MRPLRVETEGSQRRCKLCACARDGSALPGSSVSACCDIDLRAGFRANLPIHQDFSIFDQIARARPARDKPALDKGNIQPLSHDSNSTLSLGPHSKAGAETPQRRPPMRRAIAATFLVLSLAACGTRADSRGQKAPEADERARADAHAVRRQGLHPRAQRTAQRSRAPSPSSSPWRAWRWCRRAPTSPTAGIITS